MRSNQYPGCCTAKCIFDFGGTKTAEFRTGRVTKKSIETYLRTKIKECKGTVCLTAFTNDDQVEANAALRKLGFKCTRWMSKKQHAKTKIRLWWKEP